MISINVLKAREIAHGLRRDAREREMAPLDRLVALAMPGLDLADVEGQRTQLREKYATIQVEIAQCGSAEGLLEIVSREDLSPS